MAVTTFLNHVDEMGTLPACTSTAVGVRKLAVKEIIPEWTSVAFDVEMSMM
jgi:hypothetical protein